MENFEWFPGERCRAFTTELLGDENKKYPGNNR